MFASTARRRSLFVYHLHMGGPDADAIEWRSLLSPRFAPRLDHMGVRHVTNPPEADIVVVTGLLTERNVDAVLSELSKIPSPCVLIAAGDCAVNGGLWSKNYLPALHEYTLSHYADIHISVPGNPPTPQSLIEALETAAGMLANPGERLSAWEGL